jgi:maleate cis-trans isomerase
LYNIKAEQILKEQKFQASLHGMKISMQEPREKIKPITKEELDAMTEEDKQELTNKWKRILAMQFSGR